MNTKSYKIMTVIFSILIIAAIVLFYVGVFALPVSSGNDALIYSYYENFIDIMKSIGSGGTDVPTIIALVITSGLLVAFISIFGIVGVIYTIILLVKSIKCLASLNKCRGPLKSLVAYGLSMVVYISLLLGILNIKQYDQIVTIGAGPILVLVSGLICLVAAGYYHFTDKIDRRPVCSALDLATSAIGIVAMVLFFTLPIIVSYYDAGYFVGLSALIIATSSISSMPETQVIVAMALTMSGLVFSILSIIFARGVIANGFCVKLKDKRTADYPKSSIVKSIFWIVFAVAGIVLISVSKIEFGVSPIMISATALSGVCLILAIVNKVLQGKPGVYRSKKKPVSKPKPQYRYYDDDEEVYAPKKEEDTGYTPIPIDDEPVPAPKKKAPQDEDEGLTPIPIED